MKAALRRQIADRAAELAVDKFESMLDESGWPKRVHPEDLLELQHTLEDELYRELATVKG